MADADFLGKGWKYPITIENGKVARFEGAKCIETAVLSILSTAKGERVMRPDFGCGINELVFAPNNAATATLINFYVREALLQWEPRIEVLKVNAAPDPEQDNKINISIDYLIKSSNDSKNLVYPFYLEGEK